MQMIWSEETKSISIGKFVTDKLIKMTLKEWIVKVMTANNIFINTYPRKDFYKNTADTLKCTPSVLYKHFNKLQYKKFVVPYMEYASKLAFNKSGVVTNVLDKIVKNKALLDQAKDDGLMNLIPLICKYNKSPQDLKVKFSKHWKKIANTSLSKNKYLTKFDDEGAYADVPTTLLKHKGLKSASTSLMKHLTLNYKGNWKNIKPSEVHLFGDTERMASSLNKVVNPSWTPRRLKEEHDKFTKEVNARKYSKDVYVSVINIEPKKLEGQDVYAVLIDNAFDLAEEGTSMGHCVASYSSAVSNGNYLIYSIRDKEGNRLSTLGIMVIEHEGVLVFTKQQQYSKYNAMVTCEKELAVADRLISILNKE